LQSEPVGTSPAPASAAAVAPTNVAAVSGLIVYLLSTELAAEPAVTVTA
jgi:hypothetical protein